MNNPEIQVFEDGQAVAQAALEFWIERHTAATQAFSVSLAGGTTPKTLYQMLSTRDLDWWKLHLIWGDERFVPPDHADSNYRMTREAWLDKVSPPHEQVRPWNIYPDPIDSASDYEAYLREHHPHGVDLCLLGMGDDGHTASLFPGSPGLEEDELWAMSNPVSKFDQPRLTLTYPYLNMSKEILFLVTGAGKAQALREVLKEGRHPASHVRARDGVHLFLDRAAAAAL